MNILVVQNHPGSPPGQLGDSLTARGAVLHVVQPLAGDPIPAGHGPFDGVLVLGGAQSAADDAGNPYFADLFRLLRGFHGAGKPLLGICLGSQIIARVFDKKVYRHSHVEFGFLELTLTEAGRADPLLAGLPATPRIMEYHEDTFDLPDEAVLLMTGEGCRHQAYRVGETAYGFQCHIEVTREILENWVAHPAARTANGGADPAGRLQVEMAMHLDGSLHFADTVAAGWLKLATRVRQHNGLRKSMECEILFADAERGV